MRKLRQALIAIASGIIAAAWGVVSAQVSSPFVPRDHPAIEYSTRQVDDAVIRVNDAIRNGESRLTFDATPRGYLRSVLQALDVPVSSQVLVFSENSLQRKHISKDTPRAIYFNDSVAVGWAKGADTVEVTALDRLQGVHFYSIPQTREPTPQFVARDADCLQCHLLPQTYGVPGLLTMSVLPLSDNQNEYAQGWAVDHRTPIEDRWGGWYVTGAQVPATHLGNVPVLHVPRSYVRADVAPRLPTASDAFDTTGYLTPHSDIVALLVFNHQTHVTNLLTRLNWQARIALHQGRPSGALPAEVRETARELADYMLFVDEAPLPSPVAGTSSYAKDFSAKGPRDSKGRSLRDLDLTRRLVRYPCSYMIYGEAFDALPAGAKALVYERMWAILSEKVTDVDDSKLSSGDRLAIVEILRETKPGLPTYWQD